SCNSFAGKVFGISTEQVINKRVSEVVTDSKLIDVLSTGEAKKGDKEVINGMTVIRSWYPMLDGENIAGAVEIIRDVSELEALAEKFTDVRELCQELEAIIENSFDGIAVTNSKGQLLRISKSYSRITGIPWEKIEKHIGSNINDLVAKGTLTSSVTKQVLQSSKASTISQRIKDGPELMVTGSPIYNLEGEITRVVCNLRDISQLNEMKQQIKENKDLVARYYSELEELRSNQLQLDGIIVHSGEMRRAMEMATRVAKVDSTVLITGETGAGKEIIAKIIHKASPRKDGPFIAVNCGAIPETLLESELFGYDKGAFTGANRDGKLGLLEVANEGTVFLDEIGDLPLQLQVKLLRVIQEQEIVRIGGVKPVKLNIRILAATNRNLQQMVEEKKFREDLFYRLNVIPINIPPLRERREDIIPLAVHFLEKYGKKYSMRKKFSPDALSLLERYTWPGNVRELENVVERALIMSEGDIILTRNLPVNQDESKEVIVTPIAVNDILPLKEAGELLERELLSQALSMGRSTRKAAVLLGVDHSTIVRKINKYKLAINK
ncbi:MAG: sigma 54-interacting transcriptional regulator, partial [Bacillota bacterium]|nr:sigma 54-interacting transcriptional regulator [Bacillota bacterium]